MAEHIPPDHTSAHLPKDDPEQTPHSIPPTPPTAENTNMEVHHHAHHHGPKKIKTYIWEFLMLFFAVFCGFMAEYQLEHKIESDREKQYIQSMVEDLQTDTSNLRISIELFNSQNPHFDTISQQFLQLANGYHHSLRTSLKAIIGYRDFFPTDKTMQQLKYSGGMRLIRNKKSVDGITQYDAQIRRYQNGMQVLNREFEKMYDLYLEITDNALLEQDAKTKSVEELEKGANNYLLTTNKSILGKYYNQIKSYLQLRQITAKRMEELQVTARNLIESLKKEYKLAD